MCAIAHELLLTVGYVASDFWTCGMAGYVASICTCGMAAVAEARRHTVSNHELGAQTSRRGLPWTCGAATAIVASSSVCRWCVLWSFRDSESKVAVNIWTSERAAKSKADQNFRMGRMLFRRCDRHCNGCCLLDPSVLHRSWRWRGGPAEGICVHERWIHHPWMKSSWCGHEEHSHYGMHFGNMYYLCPVKIMHVLGGYTASSYSALGRFVVHFQ